MQATIARRTTTEKRTADRRLAIVPPPSGGAAAGLRAGLVIGLLMCAKTGLDGSGLFLPMRAIAGLWLGAPALLGGPKAALLGAATHLVTAALLGGIFAAGLGRAATARAAFWRGLAFGAGVWLVMTYAVVPAFDPVLARRLALAPGWWLSLHLVYGGLLGRVPAFRRRGAQELADLKVPATFY
jgi:hypothetical protein